jgi:hypothetical protein
MILEIHGGKFKKSVRHVLVGNVFSEIVQLPVFSFHRRPFRGPCDSGKCNSGKCISGYMYFGETCIGENGLRGYGLRGDVIRGNGSQGIDDTRKRTEFVYSCRLY